MRVLVLTSKFVWPLWGGGELRNFNLLKETSKNHDIVLLSFLRNESDRDSFSELEPYCEKIIGVPLRRALWKKLVHAATTWFSSKPFMLLQYTVPEMAQTLRDVIAKEKIDIVHAHFLHVGQYVDDKGEAAFVYDAHNLEHVLWNRMADTHTNPLMRVFCRLQARKFVDWQQHVAARAEAIVTLSDTDREEYLRIAPNANVTTVPNGADIDFFRPQEVAAEPNSLLYFGNFEWQPQADAALYFHREVLPQIQKRIPEVKLYLVGRSPSQAMQRLASSNVIVTGFVDDIRDSIAKAAVVVLPLRVGAGTKHRVFQALAMEKPLVTTSIGAEGIALVHGESAMIADASEKFADHCIELLQDGELRRTLSENGRRIVETEYNWELNYRKLETVFDGLRNRTRQQTL